MKIHFIVDEPVSLRSAISRCIPAYLSSPERLLKEGRVQMNNRRCKQNIFLESGQVLELTLSPESFPVIHVFREDEDWMAVEKCPGIEVCGSEGLTLEGLLRAKGLPVSACHRLDYWTGGVVLFALTEKARQAAIAVWDKQISKEYDAILVGDPPDSGDACAWITKNAKASKVRVTSRKQPKALPIRTEFHVYARKDGICRASIALHTGRTHQIRAHMAYLRTPVLGDDLYGNRTANKRFRVIHPCLWARYLRFSDALPAAFSRWRGITVESTPAYPKQIEAFWYPVV